MHAPRATLAKAVTRGLVSPYRFDMAADPQHHEAQSNDLFGRWLAHHNEQQSGEAEEQPESARHLGHSFGFACFAPVAGGRCRILCASSGTR